MFRSGGRCNVSRLQSGPDGIRRMSGTQIVQQGFAFFREAEFYEVEEVILTAGDSVSFKAFQAPGKRRVTRVELTSGGWFESGARDF